MFLANLLFFAPLSKCSEKWKERSRCWESAPSPKPLTPTPISRQPLGGFQRKCIIPYIQYFVQTIKWPGCENLLMDFIRKMAWEKRFGFFQPKMKSKPTTLILGSCVSKRAKIPCHILHFALRDLLLFSFIWHLDRPLRPEKKIQSSVWRVRDHYYDRKKSSSRLSGGCAIVIMTKKKWF